MQLHCVVGNVHIRRRGRDEKDYNIIRLNVRYVQETKHRAKLCELKQDMTTFYNPADYL